MYKNKSKINQNQNKTIIYKILSHMQTRQKSSAGYYKHIQQRNADQLTHQFGVVGAMKWESPTYMTAIGQSTENKSMGPEYIESVRYMLQPGIYTTNNVSTNQDTIMMPGTGYGYGSMNGGVITPNYTNIESRLRGLGVSRYENALPYPSLSTIKHETLHIAPQQQWVVPPPVKVEHNRPSLW